MGTGSARNMAHYLAQKVDNQKTRYRRTFELRWGIAIGRGSFFVFSTQRIEESGPTAGRRRNRATRGTGEQFGYRSAVGALLTIGADASLRTLRALETLRGPRYRKKNSRRWALGPVGAIGPRVSPETRPSNKRGVSK